MTPPERRDLAPERPGDDRGEDRGDRPARGPREPFPDGPRLDGIIVVDKPPAHTSHDVVAIVRRLAATKRVGHGGTLDPFATGVLPLFLGRATRVVEYHLGEPKRYRATVCFGASSTTDDLDGELTPADGPAPDREAVEAGLGPFRGPIRQVPPPFSAIQVGGRRAYAMARAGATPELPARDVEITALDLLEWDPTDPARPIAVVDVACSAGTYVRALARDLGRSLGSAAYLGGLVRTAAGTFRLEDAVPLQALREAAASGSGGLRRHLRSIDTGLDRLPRVTLEAADVERVRRGQPVRRHPDPPVEPGTPVRLVGPDGALVAIGRATAGGVQPDKVLVDPPGSGG